MEKSPETQWTRAYLGPILGPWALGPGPPGKPRQVLVGPGPSWALGPKPLLRPSWSLNLWALGPWAPGKTWTGVGVKAGLVPGPWGGCWGGCWGWSPGVVAGVATGVVPWLTLGSCWGCWVEKGKLLVEGSEGS